MKLKTSWIFSFIGIMGILFAANRAGLLPHSAPEEKEAILMRALVDGITKHHYDPKKIDDKFSSDVYHLYLKEIDEAKRFLTQQEIDLLKPFEKQLDDQAQAGTFQFFDLTVKFIEAALPKTENWFRDILSKPLDFSKDIKIETDGKKLNWAKNDAELRQRWENWMRYEVLNRVTRELEKQEKPDYKGEQKSFNTLEQEQREKVLDIYSKWFKRLNKADRKKRLEVYLNAFANVFDPHTGYYSPKEKENFDIQMSGKLEGIGARLQSDGEKTTVSDIVPGSPSWKEGTLQAKDIILKVGQGDEEPVEIMGWDIDDVVQKIRGPKGTTVVLHIQKPDGTEKVVRLVRDVVIMEEGFAKSLILRNGNSEDKVGYIYLPKFYADFTPQGATSCAADVAKEIEKLKREQVRGIILDLRNNGGGSLRDVVQMCGLFIEKGPIVQVKSRSRQPEILEDRDARVQYGGPLVVMVNGFSASASEILAAAMQDYGRAVIVGATTTYGKGTVQRFLDLDNLTFDQSVKPLGEMKLTVQKFYRITGRTTQFHGVTPDIILPDVYNYLEIGERDNDFPLAANTIEPVLFSQSVYNLSKLPELKTASEKRVANNPTFLKINENALRFKKQKEQTAYPLQKEKFVVWSKQQSEEAEKFENMLTPIENLKIANLSEDLPAIQSDTSRQARNEAWLKDKKKDIQLYEALLILSDMIRLDDLVGKN